MDSILFGFDLDHEQQKLVVALAPFSQFAIGGSPPNLLKGGIWFCPPLLGILGIIKFFLGNKGAMNILEGLESQLVLN